ncbi:MAG: lysophospholipid acyltransferase family protein [Myxococcales bacterium]|nr:lysophospholipid acyltransferase family protein [Myxococcales bacterium]
MSVPGDAVSEAQELALRDVREGGSWSQRQRMKNATLRALVRTALWLADRLPRSWLIGLLGGVGGLVHLVSRELRERTQRHLRRADLDPALSSLVWRNCGRNLGRCLLLRRKGALSDAVELDAESAQCLDDALAEGRGVVFVSLHLGPFEWLAAKIAEHWQSAGRGSPGPAILVRESYDPGLDPVVDQHRVGRGLEVIHRGKPGASARILRALRQGRPVGFLPDLGGRVRSEQVRWLGGLAELPIGPLRLAERTGARLLIGYLEPKPDAGFALRIAPSKALLSDHPSQALAAELEARIRRHPTHWLWMGLK